MLSVSGMGDVAHKKKAPPPTGERRAAATAIYGLRGTMRSLEYLHTNHARNFNGNCHCFVRNFAQIHEFRHEFGT